MLKGTSGTGTKPLVEGALLAGVTVVLALAGFYIPFIGIAIAFMWPVPVAVVALRHGLRVGVLTVIVAAILLTAFVGPLQAVTMTLTFGLVGLAFGHSIRQGWRPSFIVALGSFAMMISFIGGFFLGLLFLGIGLGEIEEQLQEGIIMAMEMYKGLGVSPEIMAQMEEFWDQMLEAFRLILPAALVAGAAVNSFINFQVLRAVVNRLGYKVDSLPPFERWSLPKWTLILFLFGTVAVVGDQYHGIAVLSFIGINLYTLMHLALTVQGVAMGFFLMNKYKVSKALKVFAVFALFIIPITQQAVMLLGLFDLASDYRRREVQK